jgi:DNA repair protein RadC
MNFTDQTIPLRPREKIEALGVATLTTEELLTVILGNGSRKIPVQKLVQKVHHKMNTKKNLDLDDLLAIKGMGLAKASQILAAFELVERLRPIGAPVVDTIQKVLHLVSELRYETKEHVVCLYLNARMQLVLKETLAVGSVNQSVISPRDVFSVIKQHPISFLILAHNHPSGTATPSSDDLRFTELICRSGKLLGVELLDHVIVAREEHYSCKEQGLLIPSH